MTDTDGGEVDELAGQSVSDLEEFWKFAYPDTFDGELTPVKELISWDSDASDGTFCGETTEGLVNAGFCEDDDTIGWDRTVLMPSLRNAYGDMAITMVLAHEYGHAIQKMATLNPQGRADPGGRAAGRLPGRGVPALGGRGQVAAVHPQHR